MCILFAFFGFWVNRIFFSSLFFPFCTYHIRVFAVRSSLFFANVFVSAHFYVFDSNEANREEIITFCYCCCCCSLIHISCLNLHFNKKFPFFFCISFSFLFLILFGFALFTICHNQFCAGIRSRSIGWCFVAVGSASFDSIESANHHQSRHNWQSHRSNLSTQSPSGRIGMFVSFQI